MEALSLDAVFNVIALVVSVLTLSMFFVQFSKSKSRKNMLTVHKSDALSAGTRKSKKKGVFQKLKNKVEYMFFFEPDSRRATIVFNAIVGSEIALFFVFLMLKKPLLAILLPVILHYLANKTIDIKTKNIHDYVQEELPIAIRHLIKVMSKTSDMGLIMYEAGIRLREPLKSKFLDASRKMTTETPEKVLMDFADNIQNTWVHAFVFILSNYKESSRKEDVIKNLALLSEIIDKEERLSTKAVVEKKGVVVLNWALLALTSVGFFANLIWIPSAQHFFFKTPGGMLSMLIGFTAMGFTVIINTILLRKAT